MNTNRHPSQILISYGLILAEPFSMFHCGGCSFSWRSPMKRKSLSSSTRYHVLRRDGFRCQYCGASARQAKLHIDHVNPVSRGGTNHINNLLTACAECNLGKYNSRPHGIAGQEHDRVMCGVVAVLKKAKASMGPGCTFETVALATRAVQLRVPMQHLISAAQRAPDWDGFRSMLLAQTWDFVEGWTYCE